MTLAQINEATGLKLVAGNIVSAMRKGLITKAGEVDVEKEGTRKVYTYNFVSADAMVKADGSTTARLMPSLVGMSCLPFLWTKPI